jgi:hypothetical protein
MFKRSDVPARASARRLALFTAMGEVWISNAGRRCIYTQNMSAKIVSSMDMPGMF